MRGGRGESRQTNHKLSFVYETYLAWTQNKSFLVMFLEQKNTPGNSLETPGNSWKLAGKCCPGNSKRLPALEKYCPQVILELSWKLLETRNQKKMN